MAIFDYDGLDELVRRVIQEEPLHEQTEAYGASVAFLAGYITALQLDRQKLRELVHTLETRKDTD